MPDPLVHITNGIPDSGTGNITTLGQTLTDGANLTLGTTTDLAVAAGAAGSQQAKLRAISRDIVGGIVLQPGANVIGAVTQSGAWTIGGTVTVQQATAANLNATVSGTVTANQGGTWNINNISGTVSLPTGAATAAKQPALGTAGLASADVITVQGIASMTPLKVDGSGVTQPVSGTVSISNASIPVTQSGAWSVSVSGAVAVTQSGTWTNRIVGNTGATLDFSSAQNIAAPTNCLLVGAEFNTIPTTIVSGNASPLQVDNAANLLVNVKASALPSGAATSANQPTAAGQTSTTSGQTGTLGMGAVTTGSPAYTTGQTSPLSLDTAGNLRVNVVAGGGAGGTSSSFGSAFPGTGTAAGAEYLSTPPTLTNGQMVALQTNVSGALKVDGSAVTQPVSGTFWQATQPVSGTVTANQGGTWNITNISGTVSLPTGAATSANQPSAAGQGSTTSGQTGTLAMGAVTTAPPSYTTAQTSPLSLTTVGALRVDGSAVTQPVSGTFWQATQPVSGTVTANQGGTWNINTVSNITGTISLPTGASTSANQPTNAASGSTTSGQTGNVAMGAVTTAAPSYSTGTSNWLSLTPAGALRVDGSAVTQPVSGTVSISGTVAATQSGNWTSRTVGNAGAILDFAGQNVAAPANAFLVGGEFNTTPTTIASGNASPLQLDSSGNLLVNVKAGGGAGGTSSSFGSAFPATGTAAGAEYLSSPPTLVSGNMVALQCNVSGSLKVDGSAVTQPVSGTFWQATQPVSIAAAVTVQQATAANLNATVTGTVAATQSGAWNIGNITGTVTLPTGAATSANQPSNAAQGSTTSGQTGTLAMGAVTSAIPAYTNAQTSPLSLDTGGNLRVNTIDPSIVNAGAAWNNATALNTAAALVSGPATSFNTIIGQITQTTTITGGQITFEESYDGGTTYKATPLNRLIDPSTGNQFAANPYVCVASTNQAFQLVTSGATNVRARLSTVITGTGTVTVAWTQGQIVNIHPITGTGTFPVQAAQSGTWNIGSLTSITNPVAVTGTFWQATQPVSGTVTVTQATAANLNATVTGSVSITGTPTVTVGNATLAVTQSGNWTTRMVGNAGATLDAVIGNATAPTNMLAVGGVFNTTRPTLTTGQSAAFQSNSQGVQLVDGSTVTQPVSGTFWQATQPVSIAAAVSVNATQTGNWTTRIVGNGGAVVDGVIGAATAPANMLAVGGVYNSTKPTLTTGQSAALQLNASGALTVDGSAVTQPVSGTFWQSTQPVSIAAAVAVTGTFWQATQPVSIAAAVATNPAIVATSGNAYTYSRVNAAASTNATSLKASAGSIAGIALFNTASYTTFFKLYNKASAPTVGTDTPVWTIPLPAGGGFEEEFILGEYFSTGIAYAITKLQADADTTVVVAGDVTGRIKWI